MRSSRLFATLALMMCVSSVNAQGIIGRVLNEGNGEAVVAADVQLIDLKGLVRARSVSDTAGHFRLVAPVPGAYTVRVNSIGYAPTNTSALQLDKGLELNIEIRLNTQAVSLEPLRIIAERKYRIGRLAEYYDRADWTRKTGFGKVLMRDDLERMQGVRTTNILRTYPAHGFCRPTVLLDGLEVHATEFDILDSMIPSNQIEGIEFYRSGNEIPIEYQSRAGCGLVMIWSRRDVPDGRPFTWKRMLVALGLAGGIVLISRKGF